MAEEIKLDLDPAKVLASMQELKNGVQELADNIEKSLGKQSVQSINKLEEAAEKGSNRIGKFFSDLGKHVKEDLQTAFNVMGMMEGLKFTNEMQKGITSVFEMERAFDRLRIRLGMTSNEFSKFKTQMGKSVAGTGQTLESIMPGVETMVSRGGMKDGKQISAVAEMLGKVKASTGEDIAGVTDSIVDTLKNQGTAITSKSVKDLLDVIQGTRAAGAFKTAGEAGRDIESISAIKGTKLSTREIGGLVAQASMAGKTGTGILEHILQQSQQVGGIEKMNGMMRALGGAAIFKNGKLDSEALGKVDFKKVGGLNQQMAAEISGVAGATGSDLVRFFDAFKHGNAEFKKVVTGAEENSSQFAIATDNLASKMDQFKENAKNATREIGEGLSEAINALTHGNVKGALSGLGKTMQGAWENKGTLGAGLAATAAAGFLIRGGASGLLKKIPGLGGLGGMAAGMAEGQAAKAAGVQPVYVVNYAEISGGGGGLGNLLGGASGGLGKAAGALGKGGLVAGAVLGGVEIGNALADATKDNKAVTGFFDAIINAFKGTPQERGKLDVNPEILKQREALAQQGHPEIVAAIKQGMKDAKVEVKHPLTNASPIPKTGAR